MGELDVEAPPLSAPAESPVSECRPGVLKGWCYAVNALSIVLNTVLISRAMLDPFCVRSDVVLSIQAFLMLVLLAEGIIRILNRRAGWASGMLQPVVWDVLVWCAFVSALMAVGLSTLVKHTGGGLHHAELLVIANAGFQAGRSVAQVVSVMLQNPKPQACPEHEMLLFSNSAATTYGTIQSNTSVFVPSPSPDIDQVSRISAPQQCGSSTAAPAQTEFEAPQPAPRSGGSVPGTPSRVPISSVSESEAGATKAVEQSVVKASPEVVVEKTGATEGDGAMDRDVRKGKLIKLFNAFDLQHFGILSTAFMHQIQIPDTVSGLWTQTHNDRLAREMDKNGDGTISQKEFVKWFDRNLPPDATNFTTITKAFKEVAKEHVQRAADEAKQKAAKQLAVQKQARRASLTKKSKKQAAALLQAREAEQAAKAAITEDQTGVPSLRPDCEPSPKKKASLAEMEGVAASNTMHFV